MVSLTEILKIYRSDKQKCKTYNTSVLTTGRLTPADMQGGTFTLSNGGVFGSLLSMPIINLPQSAILGMHAIVQRPVAISGKVLDSFGQNRTSNHYQGFFYRMVGNQQTVHLMVSNSVDAVYRQPQRWGRYKCFLGISGLGMGGGLSLW